MRAGAAFAVWPSICESLADDALGQLVVACGIINAKVNAVVVTEIQTAFHMVMTCNKMHIFAI